MTAAFPTGEDGRCCTVEAHLTLARAGELALAHGQISAGVQAEHYRGKAAGHEDRIRLESGPSDNVLLIVVVRSWHLADIEFDAGHDVDRLRGPQSNVPSRLERHDT